MREKHAFRGLQVKRNQRRIPPTTTSEGLEFEQFRFPGFQFRVSNFPFPSDNLQSKIMKMGRRYKTYAAETGVSYQYFFGARHNVVRPEGQGPGIDFTFVITADQRAPFTLKVFVSNRARTAWQGVHGRDLDSNEVYAAAKMCLFRAFDEQEHLSEEPLGLVVDEENVEKLLEPLDLA